MTGPRDNTRFNDDDIIALARTVEPHDFDRIDPPAQVWNNVLAELEVEVASREATARRVNQSWFSSSRILSIAAATLLMVGVAVAVVTLSGDDTPPAVEVAAAMTDEGLEVATSELADARFFCEDEACFVEVDLTALPDAGPDDLELWVINGDVSDMHTLGKVTETSATYELPADVTADNFPIIDISIEPDDGDPTHSGQSVLRGTFTTT